MLDFERLQSEIADLPVSEIVEHPEVLARLEKAIEDINAQLPEEERVIRWHLLERALSAEKGELTHTSKLRRRVVVQRFADQIAALY